MSLTTASASSMAAAFMTAPAPAAKQGDVPGGGFSDALAGAAGKLTQDRAQPSADTPRPEDRPISYGPQSDHPATASGKRAKPDSGDHPKDQSDAKNSSETGDKPPVVANNPPAAASKDSQQAATKGEKGGDDASKQKVPPLPIDNSHGGGGDDSSAVAAQLISSGLAIAWLQLAKPVAASPDPNAKQSASQLGPGEPAPQKAPGMDPEVLAQQVNKPPGSGPGPGALETGAAFKGLITQVVATDRLNSESRTKASQLTLTQVLQAKDATATDSAATKAAEAPQSASGTKGAARGTSSQRLALPVQAAKQQALGQPGVDVQKASGVVASTPAHSGGPKLQQLSLDDLVVTHVASGDREPAKGSQGTASDQGSNLGLSGSLMQSGSSNQPTDAKAIAEPIPLRSAIVDQVSQAAGGGPSSIKFVLHPENLGAVHVQVSVNDGAVSAVLRVDHPEVRDAIAPQIESLRQALSDQGIKVDRLEVNISGGGNQSGDPGLAWAGNGTFSQQERRHATPGGGKSHYAHLAGSHAEAESTDTTSSTAPQGVERWL